MVTKLYYNRFRYYLPNSGVYLSQDFIEFEDGNPTLYRDIYDANSSTDVFERYNNVLFHQDKIIIHLNDLMENVGEDLRKKETNKINIVTKL